MKQEPHSRRTATADARERIPALQGGEDVNNATLPYVLRLADSGWREALRRDPALASGLNTHEGNVVYGPVAQAHGLEPVELAALLG